MADDLDRLWISSEQSSAAGHDQAGHEPGDGFDKDTAPPYKRPKFSASHAPSYNVPLPRRLAKVVPLARDEWDLSRLILQGVGSSRDPVPSIEAQERTTDEDIQHSDEFLIGRPTLYSDRPTEPDELETWKRIWVEEGLREEIPGFTRFEKAALQKKDEEEKARMLAEAQEAGIDLTREDPAAVRPRLRPLRTGPPDFWIEEIDREPDYMVEETVRNEADHTVGELRRQGWEWTEDMDGIRQPPLGARLEHTLDFLREEDYDRCPDWEDKVKEVEHFLAWAGRTYGLNDAEARNEAREGGQIVSTEVRNMYVDALRKLQVHRVFEEWQHESAKPALQSLEEAIDIVSRRQPGWVVRRDAAAHFRFVPRQQKQELEPRNMLVAKPLRVNTLHPAGSHEGKVLRTELEKAGSHFWEDNNTDPRTNLYMVEDAAYRSYNIWKEGWPTIPLNGERLLPDPEEIKRLNRDNAVDAVGRVPVDIARERDEALKMDFGLRPKPRWMTDDEYVELTKEVERRAQKQSSPGHAMDDTDLDSESGTDDSMPLDETQAISHENSPDGSDGDRYTFDDLRRQAEIRGTRRGALQEALRYFTSAPQASAQTKFTTLIPPIEQRYLDRIIQGLDRNHQYLSSRATQAVAWENEPMPYTVLWRLHRQQMQKWSEKALKEVTLEHAQDSIWVDIPRNIACGGPFVQGLLSPKAEKDESLLKLCETALQAIEQAVQRNGSQLLSDVYTLAKDVVEDGIDPVLLPDDVNLRRDEIYGKGGAMSVKLLSPEDVKWLLFMTGRAVNKRMLQPLGGKKLRLYNIFVQRLQKLMDDRSQTGLFPKKESTATVEELMEVMNAACHGPVERTIFTPFQAKFFLKRAQEQGFCTYRPDLLVYGIVGRPDQTIFPWDHIVFDGDSASSTAKTSESYSREDQDIRGQITQIFHNLGYRLGVTIHSLRQSEPSQPEEQVKPKIIITLPKIEKTLTMSLGEYESTLADLVKTYELSHLKKTGVPRTLSLINLVSNARLSDTRSASLYYPPHAPSAEAYLRDINNKKDYATETSALHHVRRQLILESHHNLPLLSRSRPRTATASGNVIQANNTWDHNWDWASPSVRGPVRQFFNVNRWPLNFQTPATQLRIQSDAEIDERYLLDVDAEDPIPKDYFRQKLRRYGEEDDEGERVFRPGTPQFWDGDTVSQQKYVRKLLEERIGDG